MPPGPGKNATHSEADAHETPPPSGTRPAWLSTWPRDQTPPFGFRDTSTSPVESTATQNLIDGQETPVSGALSRCMTLHEDAGPPGRVEVTTSPV